MSVSLQPTGKNAYGITKTFDIFNQRVLNHEVFGISKRYDLAASGELYIIVDPTENGTFTKRQLVLLPITISAFGAGPITIDIHAGITHDGLGTKWDLIDRNFVSPVTPHTVIRAQSSILTTGTQTPYEDRIESAAGALPVDNAIGGATKDDLIIKIDQTVIYAIHMTNTDASNAARGTVHLNLFEVA